jgi:hypothetical protein
MVELRCRITEEGYIFICILLPRRARGVCAVNMRIESILVEYWSNFELSGLDED